MHRRSPKRQRELFWLLRNPLKTGIKFVHKLATQPGLLLLIPLRRLQNGRPDVWTIFNLPAAHVLRSLATKRRFSPDSRFFISDWEMLPSGFIR